MPLGGSDEAAVRELGDATLNAIAQELVKTLRKSTMVDWTIRETVRAALRVKVKNLLRRYHYPLDRQEAATTTVLQQAEILCAESLCRNTQLRYRPKTCCGGHWTADLSLNVNTG